MKFTDAEFPDANCVADGKEIRPWSDEVARELAVEAMLLAQGAERAQELFDAAATAGHGSPPPGAEHPAAA